MNYFGTDGIRGVYGDTLTDGTAYQLGYAIACDNDCPIVVVARDTRISGERLFTALSNGVYDGGGNVINLGVLPTNAVSHFVRKFGGDYGVMISASHNPPRDNGLKVFDNFGIKINRKLQETISQRMSTVNTSHLMYRVCEPVFYNIDNIYVEDIINTVGTDLTGMNIALDCCYGASYHVAGKLFEKLNAQVTCYNNTNKGKWINVNCGATNPNYLLNKLKNTQLAFSFDGDCDRIAVYQHGKLVSNNKVYYAIAKYLHANGKLTNNTAVGTVLTNGGVRLALNNIGIRFVASNVGDVNVFYKMAELKSNFGGEESGHYILADYATGSDSLITALFICNVVKQCGSIEDYTAECSDLPFVKLDVDDNGSNGTRLDDVAERVNVLYPSCRLVLRRSGTENKIRIYAEGDDCEDAAKCVVATVLSK